jgi:hypothetical protein
MFRLEGALALDSGRDFSSTITLVEVAGPRSSGFMPALLLWKTTDPTTDVLVTLRSPTGAICIPLPREFTHREALSELANCLRVVRRASVLTTLDETTRGRIPVEDFRIANFTDFLIYTNGNALTLPFSGKVSYSARAVSAIHRAMVDVLPNALVDLVGAYVTPPPAPNSDRHQHDINVALDATLDTSVTTTEGIAHVMFIIGHDAMGVHRCTPGFCPVQFRVDDPRGESTNSGILSDFLEEGATTPKSALHPNSSDCHSYVLSQRYLRARVMVELTIIHLGHRRTKITFPCAGTVGQLLRESPSISLVMEQALGLYADFMKDTYGCLSLCSHCLVLRGNPLDGAGGFNNTHWLPLSLLLSASVCIRAKPERMYLQMPPPNRSLGDDLRYRIAARMIESLTSTDNVIYSQQAAVSMLNNHFLILRYPKKTMRTLLEDLARQLRELTMEEENWDRGDAKESPRCFSTLFPVLRMTPGVVPLGEDVEVIPWLQRMLEMDMHTAVRAIGLYSVTFGLFRYRSTLLAAPPGRELRTPVTFDEDCLAPCVTEPFHLEDFPTFEMTVNDSSFWRLPISRDSFNGSIGAVCTYLDITASLRPRHISEFKMGSAVIVDETARESLDVPYREGTVFTNTALWKIVERYFHAHATLAVDRFQALLGYEANTRRNQDTEGKHLMVFPRLFSHAKSIRDGNVMSSCVFDLMVDRVPMKRLMGRWGCTLVKNTSEVRLRMADVCSDSMPSSVLSGILANLPHCLTVRRVRLDPIRTTVPVPYGTSPCVLALAVHLRRVQCGCNNCNLEIGAREWALGEDIARLYDGVARCTSADNGLKNDRLVTPQPLRCTFIPGEVPTLHPIPNAKTSAHCPELQRFLACVAPEGADFLMTKRFFASGQTVAKLAIHFIVNYLILTACNCGYCHSKAPLLPNELDFHGRVRFVWLPEGSGNEVHRGSPNKGREVEVDDSPRSPKRPRSDTPIAGISAGMAPVESAGGAHPAGQGNPM